MTVPRFLLLLVLAGLPVLPALLAEDDLHAEAVVHLQLDESAPAADATVASPAELRLWFSQEPQAEATSARLIRDGEPVAAMGDLRPDPEDATVFFAPVEGTLAAGSYTVAWRAMAADGHVVRGDFQFTVRGQ